MEKAVLKEIRGKVLVSCQGGRKPFYLPEHMLMMAQAAHAGGCAGFRANLPENIAAIKAEFPDVPMIGIYKIVEGDSEVYITPNMDAVDKLVELKCEIIALDGTNRKNYSGKYAWEFLAEVREKYPDQCLMADIATLEDAILSAKAGADILATTLSGYTEDSKEFKNDCNFELLSQIRDANLGKFIVCEGKIRTVDDAAKAFDSGADALVIGGAITNPISITQHFVDVAKAKAGGE